MRSGSSSSRRHGGKYIGTTSRGKIWITRSEPGATRLADVLEQAGYGAWLGPVLQIEPLQLAPIDVAPNLVVVLSEHAAVFGQALPWRSWAAAGSQVFAVGERTAGALAPLGVSAISPNQSSSEGLLAELLPASTVAGQQVLLLAGEGGRDTLRQELTMRGANVQEMSLYRRVPTAQLAVPSDQIGGVCVSSGDGLLAAAELWAKSSSRVEMPVFVPSQRVVELARGIGWHNAYNCAGAGPAAVLETLATHYRVNAQAGD